MRPTTDSNPSTDPLVVFRPRRRCGRCGLVNVDGARRCRRCQKSFADIDPAVESEQVYRRSQTRRVLIVSGVLVLLIGFVVAYFAYSSRADRLARFDANARMIRADVRSLQLASRDDARAILNAFNDSDARVLLQAQKAYWLDRSTRCVELKEQLDGLVPSSAGQVDLHLALRNQIDALKAASDEFAGAADVDDLELAQRTARTLAEAQVSPAQSPQETGSAQ